MSATGPDRKGKAADGVGPDRAGTPAGEWAVAAVGAAVLLAMVGYLAWMGLVGEEGPPALSVRVERVQPAGEGWLVLFVAANDGPSAAATVRVRGRLGEDSAVEESVAVLDYVPQRSERRGGLMFSRDPGAEPLELRVEGYERP